MTPSRETVAFNIKFESESHRIDSLTYVKTLVSTTTILKELNYQVGIGENLNIDVIAENAGSFEVVLEAIATGLNVLNMVGMPSVSNLIPLLTGAIGFKKIFSKADQTQTEEVNGFVHLKDNSGTVINIVEKNTYNIYTNSVVDESIAEQFSALKNNPEIGGITITSPSGTTRIPRSDFGDLSTPISVTAPEEKISLVDTRLTIAGTYFESRNRAWVFIYQGSRISAPIRDQRFWDEVDDGKRFAKGDKLVVSLKIYKEYDSSLEAYVNTGYEVVEVRDHEPRAQASQPEIPN